MYKKVMTFGNMQIEKHKFYYHKKPTFLEDQNVDKILLSNKTSSSKNTT